MRSVPPPRYPSVTRDISFWIDAAVTADEQRDACWCRPPSRCCASWRCCEDYRDPKYAPVGKKGMLWSLTYRADDRTLTDAEVDAAHARVVAGLEAGCSRSSIR